MQHQVSLDLTPEWALLGKAADVVAAMASGQRQRIFTGIGSAELASKQQGSETETHSFESSRHQGL